MPGGWTCGTPPTRTPPRWRALHDGVGLSEACAKIVARDDPHLFATALFAPEPARSRLMVLYAFDIELSRATRASGESLIPRMRLQFWRDVIEAAEQSEPAKAHEVAGPLAALIDVAGSGLAFTALVDAHEATLDWPAEDAPILRDTAARFAGRLGLALQQLEHPPNRGNQDRLLHAQEVASSLLAWAFWFRNMARMAAAGHLPLKGPNGALAALSQGHVSDEACVWLRQTASEQLETGLAWRRGARLPKALIAAFLPVMYAERTVRMVKRDPSVVLGGLEDLARPFDGFRLIWRALSGRW